MYESRHIHSSPKVMFLMSETDNDSHQPSYNRHHPQLHIMPRKRNFFLYFHSPNIYTELKGKGTFLPSFYSLFMFGCEWKILELTEWSWMLINNVSCMIYIKRVEYSSCCRYYRRVFTRKLHKMSMIWFLFICCNFVEDIEFFSVNFVSCWVGCSEEWVTFRKIKCLLTFQTIFEDLFDELLIKHLMINSISPNVSNNNDLITCKSQELD